MIWDQNQSYSYQAKIRNKSFDDDKSYCIQSMSELQTSNIAQASKI